MALLGNTRSLGHCTPSQEVLLRSGPDPPISGLGRFSWIALNLLLRPAEYKNPGASQAGHFTHWELSPTTLVMPEILDRGQLVLPLAHEGNCD